ncbi:MAG: hypothetical protein OEZ34_17470 [Spirochaetia bacterium]|nr:hypothetical protein [Spirochaetia bacterium]
MIDQINLKALHDFLNSQGKNIRFGSISLTFIFHEGRITRQEKTVSIKEQMEESDADTKRK